jgi:hypothetical protein
MLEPNDQIAVNTLFILGLMTLFGWWTIKKHYDNAWNIEKLQIELNNLKYKTSDFDKETEKDIAILRAETINIVQSMRKMQDDIIEGKQNDINIDAKYRIKLNAIDEMLEQTSISEGIDLKDGVAFDPMKNRTSAEKRAYDKLAKQISGSNI